MKYLLASLVAVGLMGVLAPVVAADGVISYYPSMDNTNRPSYYCLAEGQPNSPCNPKKYLHKTFNCPDTGSLPVKKQGGYVGGMGTPSDLYGSGMFGGVTEGCPLLAICKKKNNKNTTYFECKEPSENY